MAQCIWHALQTISEANRFNRDGGWKLVGGWQASDEHAGARIALGVSTERQVEPLPAIRLEQSGAIARPGTMGHSRKNSTERFLYAFVVDVAKRAAKGG